MIGKNLAYEDSFRLQVNNTSNQAFRLNLFNLGGSSGTQTAITSGTISQLSFAGGAGDQLAGCIVNGVVAATLQMTYIYPDLTTSAPFNFPIGTTIAQINAAFNNNVVNQQGQVGSFVMQQVAGNSIAYTGLFTVPNIYSMQYVTSTPPLVFLNQFYFNQPISFVSGNPFVQLSGTADINFIQNSEIGNSYKIMGMDVFSTNSEQVLQGLNYVYRDVNGNLQSFGSDPLIDPYQPQRGSIQMIDVDGFQIHTNTQFNYTIEALTEVFLTFNYVRAGYNEYAEFNAAFSLKKRKEYVERKLMLDRSQDRDIIFVQ